MRLQQVVGDGLFHPECGLRLTKNFLKILEAHSWQRGRILNRSYQSLVDVQ